MESTEGIDQLNIFVEKANKLEKNAPKLGAEEKHTKALLWIARKLLSNESRYWSKDGSNLVHCSYCAKPFISHDSDCLWLKCATYLKQYGIDVK